MGLSASQARFLTLTARKSDLEYRAQQISNSRLVLSKQLEEIATEYTNAQSNRNLFTSGVSPTPYQQVNTTNLAQSGFQVVVVSTGERYDAYTPPAGQYKKSIEDGLRDGTYILARTANPFSQQTMSIVSMTGLYEAVDWRTVSAVSDDEFTADDGDSETKYELKVASFNQKDKSLTLEMQSLETDHKAVESEMEAIKKVIQNNAESSFKTFA